MADQVLVMDEGKIIEQGTPYQLFTAPAADITRRFVESHFGRLLTADSWQNDALPA